MKPLGQLWQNQFRVLIDQSSHYLMILMKKLAFRFLRSSVRGTDNDSTT